MRTFAYLIIVLGLLSSNAAWAARPDFQFSATCGQLWDISTYEGHWPDPDSLDATIRGSGQLNKGKGQPIRAMAPGVVKRSFIRSSDGEARVFIEHQDGWVSHYIHNQVTDHGLIAEGRKVAQGEVIGFTGKSGASSIHQHVSQINPTGVAVRQQFDGNKVDTRQSKPSTWGTWGTRDAERVRSANCAGNKFMTWRQGGETYTLIYQPVTGDGKIMWLKKNGEMQRTWIGHVGTDYTHFAAYQMGNNAYAAFYQASDGDIRFYRLNNAGNGFTQTGQARWYNGWTHLVPFYKDGRAHLLAYSSLYGFANIEQVHPDGSGTNNIKRTTLPKGYTSLFTYISGPNQYLASYKGSNGKFDIRKIRTLNDTLELSDVWSKRRRPGWTSLLPFYQNGKHYMFGYEAPTGLGKMWELDNQGEGFSVTADRPMQLDWTGFTTWPTESGNNLLAYKISNGLATTFRFKSGATGLVHDSDKNWSKGWR